MKSMIALTDEELTIVLRALCYAEETITDITAINEYHNTRKAIELEWKGLKVFK